MPRKREALTFGSPDDLPEDWIGKTKTSKRPAAATAPPPPFCTESIEQRREEGFKCSCPSNPLFHDFHQLDWYTKIRILWPHLFSADFGEHHLEAWDHVIDQDPEQAAQALALILPRGGGKSTTAESMTAFLGIEGIRKYALYISGGSDAADGHVESIAELLEADTVAYYYPQHAEKAVGKFGNAKGWRRNRLQTAGGFVVDAAGLDTKVRGLKRNSVRPDLMVVDDVDEADDGPTVTARRWSRLTTSLLPAGANDGSTLVVVVQNLVHRDGVVSRIMRHKDGVLQGAKIIGPIPALYDVQYGADGVPTAGRPSWPAGQPLEVCQRQARLWGAGAFRTESQHDFNERPGALWKTAWIVHDSTITVEDCLRVVIGYDPAVSDDDDGDEHGIVVVGLLPNRRAVVLADYSGHYTTQGAALKAHLAEEQFGAEIIYETNQGKDHVRNTLRSGGCVRLRPVVAKGSKKFRAAPCAQVYEIGYNLRQEALELGTTPPEPIVVHAQKLVELEAQMVGWVPDEDSDSPDRVDALVHALTELGVFGSYGLSSVTSRVRQKVANAVAAAATTIAPDPRQAARAAREEAIKRRRESSRARHANARRSLD